MYSLNELFSLLNEIAPISLSEQCVKEGDYDNSGVLIKSTDKADRILFSLDLSEKAVERAKRLKCDTVVTHHPAIYYPVKKVSVEDCTTKPVALALNGKLNVVSMHLNLDIATNGIDHNLALGLKAEKYQKLSSVNEKNGYGRQFDIERQTYGDYVKDFKKEFCTDKVVCYGKKSDIIGSVASFCGGGASYCEKALSEGKLTADLIVTSDVPHHVVKEIVESGKKLMIIPHYVAENYGFKRFFEEVTDKVKNKAITFYFEDERFI